MKEIDIHAETLWEYHVIDNDLEESDFIIGLGSYDPEVARYCAKIFQHGLAPLLVFTGKEGNWTKGNIAQTEAKIFSDIATKAGVNPEKIIIEENATNISQNIEFTRELLSSRGIFPKKVIVVTKPNTTRRAMATTLKVWPEVTLLISSPDLTYKDFPTKIRTKEEIINEMVGDIQRLKIYGERGWQMPQAIPENVWDSYNKLISLGYTNHLLNE